MRAALLLSQPASGVPTGDSTKEKMAIVRLTQSGRMLKSININNLEDVRSKWGVFAEMPIQGTYTIESADFTENSSSFTIGGSEPPTNKYWGYDIRSRRLIFMTLENLTGGGAMSNGNNPVNVKQDMVLSLVQITNSGFEPNQPPKNLNGYGTGFVHVKSWIKPFEQRIIYWTDYQNSI